MVRTNVPIQREGKKIKGKVENIKDNNCKLSIKPKKKKNTGTQFIGDLGQCDF